MQISHECFACPITHDAICSLHEHYNHQKALIFKYFNEKIDNLPIQAAVDNGQNRHKAIRMIGLPALIIMNSVSCVLLLSIQITSLDAWAFTRRITFHIHSWQTVIFFLLFQTI